MLTFKFTLLAVLSYVAMISATPLGNGTPTGAIDRRQEYAPGPLATSRGGSCSVGNIIEAIDRRQEYAPLTISRGDSDPIEHISPAQTPLTIRPITAVTVTAMTVKVMTV